MRRLSRLTPLLIFTLLLLLVGDTPAQTDPALFRELPRAANSTAQQPAVPSLEVLAQRRVRLAPGLLPTPGAAFSGTHTANRLTLNLFPGATYTATFTHAQTRPSGQPGYLWQGTLDNLADSSVVLVVGADGGVTGHVIAEGRTFEVYNLEDGTHIITEIVESRYLNRGANDLIDLPPSVVPPVAGNAVTTTPDDGSEIDIMVVYTATAVAQFSSEAQLLGKIDANIAAFNTINDKSDVAFTANLVYAGQTDYLEQSTSRVDLANMVNGSVPGLHALRNTYAADIVSMIVGKGDADICGIAATIGGTITTGDSAFNIVRHNCLGSGRTFTHEAGHNMGIRHDLANGGAAFTYANGYQDPDGNFSTIMAYWFNGNCEPSDCPRITYWANPRLDFSGRPLGNPDTADAARALNENAYTVANYRRRAATYRVLLNEVSVGGRSFVELLNADTASVSLLGWAVSFYTDDALTTTFTFPSFEMDPGRIVLFDTGDGDNFGYPYEQYLNTDLGWAGAAGGAVVLQDAAGNVVDFVRFGAAALPPPTAAEWDGANLPAFSGEQTYGRPPGAADTDSAADWVLLPPTLGDPNPDPAATPPPNDLYTNALAVTLPFTEAVNAEAATRWPLEPPVGALPGCEQAFYGAQASLWYTLTVPADTRVEVNTLGGPQNTIVAVWAEGDNGDLTPLACNIYPDLPLADDDDDPDNGDQPGRGAGGYGYAGPYAGALGIEGRVIFAAQASTTYRVLVGQVYAGPGAVRVNMFPHYPDFNADFVYTPADVAHVLNRLGAPTPADEDVNGDGVVNQTDADLLLTRVGEGVTVTLGPPLAPPPER